MIRPGDRQIRARDVDGDIQRVDDQVSAPEGCPDLSDSAAEPKKKRRPKSNGER